MCREVTAHERYWLQEVKNLQASYKSIVAQYPDADDVLQQVYRVLGDLVSLDQEQIRLQWRRMKKGSANKDAESGTILQTTKLHKKEMRNLPPMWTVPNKTRPKGLLCLTADRNGSRRDRKRRRPTLRRAAAPHRGRKTATNSSDIISKPDTASKNFKRPGTRQLRVP
jgi:hypothetical protein